MVREQQKKSREEEIFSMNGWDSFVDQYTTKKRTMEKSKSSLPLVSKVNSRVSLANDKKQRSAYTVAQVILPAKPNESWNTD